MATNFPTGLDDFANYVDGTTIMEAALLNDMQFAIEKLEAKVGIDSSAVSSSHDYKLANLPAFGGYATDDDDSQTMLAAHAYLANQDGKVYVVYTTGPSGGATSVYCYVDTDANPTSGGTIFAQRYDSIYTQVGDKFSLQFDVASGEYFEITKSNVASISIIWRSKSGTLIKCTDQD